jgi:hypothetical protein
VVKLGFIVEGRCEKTLIESRMFREWLARNGLELTSPVIDAKGGGNLLPDNIGKLIEQIKRQHPNYVIVLTDLEREVDEEAVRQRIQCENIDLIFIAVKALEAWYLADSQAMNNWLRRQYFYEERPQETIDLPWEHLKVIAREYHTAGLGVGQKIMFTKKMMKTWGFNIERAAQHPHCPSAKAFHDGLLALAESA